MDAVLRRAVGAGLPVPDAVAAASATPARVLGIDDRVGALRPGLAANVVVTDEAFRLRAVMRHGQWLTASR
jgi:N-acetylglucosamine-6-phosphate deacetylase